MISDSPAWPSVEFEMLPWELDQTLPVSLTAKRRHLGPYRAAIPARIAECDVSIPSELAALVDDATAEVARFDTDVGHEFGPFAAVLLQTESAASSAIENLTASARGIAEAQLGPVGRSNAALIVANSASRNKTSTASWHH